MTDQFIQTTAAIEREREKEQEGTVLVPTVIIFLGGLATRACLAAIEQMQKLYGGHVGPLAFLVVDSVKEKDFAKYGFGDADTLRRFVHIKPKHLRAIFRTYENSRMAQSMSQVLENYGGGNTPGIGGYPPAGFANFVLAREKVRRSFSELVDKVRADSLKSVIADDPRLPQCDLNEGQLRVWVVAGMGGTSGEASQAAGMMARDEAVDCTLSLRLLMGDCYRSCAEGAREIVPRNTGAAIITHEAIQRRRGVDTVLNSLDEEPIRIGNDDEPLWNETVLYSQCPGEELSKESIARKVGVSLVYEALTAAGQEMHLREIDFRDSLSSLTLLGQPKHYSAVGIREISAVATDLPRRLPAIITDRILHSRLDGEVDAATVADDVARAASGARLNGDGAIAAAGAPPAFPPIGAGSTQEDLEASVARAKHEMGVYARKVIAASEDAFDSARRVFRGALDDSADMTRVSILHAYCSEAAEHCRRVAAGFKGRARRADADRDAAGRSLGELITSMLGTDDWLQDFQDAGTSLLSTALGPWYLAWSGKLDEFAAELDRRTARVDQLRSALTKMAATPLPVPQIDKRTLLSVDDVVRVGGREIQVAAARFDRGVAGLLRGRDMSVEAVEAIIDPLAESVAAELLEQCRTPDQALVHLAASGVDVPQHLRDEVEQTEIMLTVDEARLAGSPMHDTIVVLVPNGTRARLAALGVDLDKVDGFMVREGRVDDVVIMIARRGFATSCIEEVERGIKATLDWIRQHPRRRGPWLADDNTPALPIPINIEQEKAALLIGRLRAAAMQDGSPWRFDVDAETGETFLVDGDNRTHVANADMSVLEGLRDVASRGEIDTGQVMERLSQFYRQQQLDEESALRDVMRHMALTARGADYETVLYVFTAVWKFIEQRQAPEDRISMLMGGVQTNGTE